MLVPQHSDGLMDNRDVVIGLTTKDLDDYVQRHLVLRPVYQGTFARDHFTAAVMSKQLY